MSPNKRKPGRPEKDPKKHRPHLNATVTPQSFEFIQKYIEKYGSQGKVVDWVIKEFLEMRGDG